MYPRKTKAIPPSPTFQESLDLESGGQQKVGVGLTQPPEGQGRAGSHRTFQGSGSRSGGASVNPGSTTNHCEALSRLLPFRASVSSSVQREQVLGSVG